MILRWVLAGVMLYAALPKFFSWESFPPTLDFAPFARIVYNYRVLPTALVNLAAFSLPMIEALGAACLLTGVWLRSGTLMLALLQTVFLVGMGQAWLRGLDIECGCFVGIDTKVGLLTIARDSLFLIGFVIVLWATRGPILKEAEEAIPAASVEMEAE